MSSSEEVTQLEALAASIVERARAQGADGAEVVLTRGRESSIEVRNGAIETLHQGAPSGLSVRLWKGERSASSGSTDLRKEVVDRLLGETLELAAIADPVPERVLTPAAELATEVPELDLFDGGLAGMEAAEKVRRALEAEEAALGVDERISASRGASFGDYALTRVLATSEGFCRGWRSTFVRIGASVVADDAGGKKRDGSWGSVARHLEDLEPAGEVGREAGARAIRDLGAGPIPTASMPVVFEDRVAASLIGLLFSTVKGGALERRSSWLIDRLGETIGSELLTVIDEPHRVRGPGSRPFDGEGRPTARTVFFEKGVLRSWALNSYHARRLGLQPTGHGGPPGAGASTESASNLYLAAGAQSPEAIIGEVDYGFYCTGMMGFGFNAATGDFSRGARGFLIEKGKLTRPVSEVTLSANFADLFARLDAVGNDLRLDRSVAAPTIRISQMTVAGT